jgi:hypothetical protein
MYLFSRNFWIYSFERIVKTGIVTLVAIMAADQFVPTSGDQWARAALQIGVACLGSLSLAMTAYSSASGTQSTPTNIAPKTESSVPLFTVKS